MTTAIATASGQRSALVLFSGGQDSTTCLADALERFEYVETVGFDYGQRHAIELAQRPIVIGLIRERFPAWRERLGADHVLALPTLARISETALTRQTAIEMTAAGLPSTFVPGRNLLLFTYAAALGYRRGISTLVGGMCETDYSGYPDCRDETLQTLGKAIALGLDRPIAIDTPLMWIDKAGTWALAERLGGQVLVDIIRQHTHSCYLGDRVGEHDWGRGCGTCPACELRADGWRRWRGADASARR